MSFVDRCDNHKRIIEYFLAILIYLSIPPCFVWGIRNELILLIVFLVLLFSLSKGKTNKSNLIFTSVFVIIYCYIASRDNPSAMGLIARSILPCILVCSCERYFGILDKFINIYSALLIPSIVMYIIVVICGFSLPYIEIQPLNELKNYGYYSYPFLLTTDNHLSLNYYRFMSWFDEPGVVGTTSCVLLFLTGFNFKKWQTYPLLISGLLSFSLAFIVMLIAYILLFEPARIKVIMIFIILLLCIALYDNDIINNLILKRLQFVNGELAGMNRTTDNMNLFMQDFIRSNKLFFGYGNQYASIVNNGGASYKDLIVNYGIFGFFLLVSITVIFAWHKLKFSRYFFIYMLIWISVIYQRPFINSFFYFSLLYLPLYYFDIQYKHNCPTKILHK